MSTWTDIRPRFKSKNTASKVRQNKVKMAVQSQLELDHHDKAIMKQTKQRVSDKCFRHRLKRFWDWHFSITPIHSPTVFKATIDKALHMFLLLDLAELKTVRWKENMRCSVIKYLLPLLVQYMDLAKSWKTTLRMMHTTSQSSEYNVRRYWSLIVLAS